MSDHLFLAAWRRAAYGGQTTKADVYGPAFVIGDTRAVRAKISGAPEGVTMRPCAGYGYRFSTAQMVASAAQSYEVSNFIKRANRDQRASNTSSEFRPALADDDHGAAIRRTIQQVGENFPELSLGSAPGNASAIISQQAAARAAPAHASSFARSGGLVAARSRWSRKAPHNPHRARCKSGPGGRSQRRERFVNSRRCAAQGQYEDADVAVDDGLEKLELRREAAVDGVFRRPQRRGDLIDRRAREALA